MSASPGNKRFIALPSLSGCENSSMHHVDIRWWCTIMLELFHVVKEYGRDTIAVDDVSLDLAAGVVGLIGHNGAGKTTLLQMIATLIKPSSGTIKFHGVDIVRKPDALRRRLGFLPQDFGVYPNLSALEFLQYFAALKGVRDQNRVLDVLRQVNLHEHAHRPAASFSGGMRRRLGIAQALLNDPEVLIVDEPTAGLDPEERVRFRQLLRDIGSSKLVIVSTHIVSDVEHMAGYLAIMRRGRLIAFDTPAAIVSAARGQIWSAQVDEGQYQHLRDNVRVLQAEQQQGGYLLRIAHPHAPVIGAIAEEPRLEEALMTHRFVFKEQAA
jgi:ABC-2 type transport system ATP-binding protein